MVWQPIKSRVQSELIKRGHCVACCKSLSEADRRPSAQNDHLEIVSCTCRRVYLYDKRLNHYRRALDEEVAANQNPTLQ